MAAKKLDPNLQGHDVSPNESMNANEFINDTVVNMGLDESNVLAEFGKYQNREVFWGRQLIWKGAIRMTLLWWKTYVPDIQLTQVAMRLLSTQTTSAAAQRSLSAFGWIHNAKKKTDSQQNVLEKLTYLSF